MWVKSPTHPIENGTHQKEQKPCRNAKKKEPAFTTGGNIGWFNLLGKKAVRKWVSIWSSNSTFLCLIQRPQISNRKNSGSAMFIILLFTITQTQSFQVPKKWWLDKWWLDRYNENHAVCGYTDGSREYHAEEGNQTERDIQEWSHSYVAY